MDNKHLRQFAVAYDVVPLSPFMTSLDELAQRVAEADEAYFPIADAEIVSLSPAEAADLAKAQGLGPHLSVVAVAPTRPPTPELNRIKDMNIDHYVQLLKMVRYNSLALAELQSLVDTKTLHSYEVVLADDLKDVLYEQRHGIHANGEPVIANAYTLDEIAEALREAQATHDEIAVSEWDAMLAGADADADAVNDMNPMARERVAVLNADEINSLLMFDNELADARLYWDVLKIYLSIRPCSRWRLETQFTRYHWYLYIGTVMIGIDWP